MVLCVHDVSFKFLFKFYCSVSSYFVLEILSLLNVTCLCVCIYLYINTHMQASLFRFHKHVNHWYF